MEMIDPLGECLQLIVPVFEELEILYYIGGSVATFTHGNRRQTNDVDIVADIREEHILQLSERLGAFFLVDDQMIKRSLRYGSSFNLIHLKSIYKVDIFPLKTRPYDHEAASRRQRELVEGEPSVEAFVASPEDVVLAKLEWFVATNKTSEKQWNDITGVLKTQCFTIDLDYLQHWANEIGVTNLLDKALDESGITELTEETESNGDSD